MGLSQYPGMPHFRASLDERKVFIKTHMDDFHDTCRLSASTKLLEELRKICSLTDSGIIITGTYAHLKRERVRLSNGAWIGTNKQYVRNLQELLGMQDANPVADRRLARVVDHRLPVDVCEERSASPGFR